MWSLVPPYYLSAPSDSPYLYVLYGALLIAVVYFVVKSQTINLLKTRDLLRKKEAEFDQVHKQKLVLEARDKDITESLVYAQRIQEALLPSEEYFRSYFSDSFVLFRPKDIVSGDFYWIEKKDGKIFIAGADCTGHGVPGALMSMIGLEIIEKTVNIDNIQKPSAVLGVLNRELENTFRRHKNIGTIIRDGMDIGFCVIDTERKKIEYSGAFFPLYLFRDGSLTEIKGDKLIIGMNPSGISYTNHEIDLVENDVLYMFSDGYVDQFGGTENRKFMYRRFRYLLTTIHNIPMEGQKLILEDNLKAWMAGNIQVDDILVIGFKPLAG